MTIINNLIFTLVRLGACGIHVCDATHVTGQTRHVVTITVPDADTLCSLAMQLGASDPREVGDTEKTWLSSELRTETYTVCLMTMPVTERRVA